MTSGPADPHDREPHRQDAAAGERDARTAPASHASGLSPGQVAERVRRGEVNDIPVRSSRSTAEIIRSNVLTRFNAIIGALFVVIVITAPIQDGLFGFVIVANTLIGIIQEMRAKKTLENLAVIGEAKPVVRREGRSQEIPTSGIVLDDVVELGPGDKAVVDGTVLESDGLEIDESLLTGEADAVLKKPGDTVMSGSFVVAGNGAFTATKVGREAYAAQLAEEASRFTLVHSELRSGINSILRFVTYLLFPTAGALVASQLYVEKHDIREAVRRMIGGIVPMVPEGLVLLTSVAFAIGVIRLGLQRCLVQELPAIEGLARVDTVCLDKTGTLTEGGMNVRELRLLPHDDPPPPETPETAEDPAGPEGDGAPGGDPTTRAVLGALGAADPRPNASLQAIIDAYPAPEGWHTVDTLPFSSARQYSGALLTDPSGGSGLWLLGAPDVLLPEGHDALPEVESLNQQGLRLLLLTRPSEGSGLHDPELGTSADAIASHTPAALVVLEQRLRPDAADTLRYFADEDVRIKVISGDNAVSVGAVAAGLGLPGADSPVDARQLPAEPEAMAGAIDEGSVFGRVTPRQKQEMVAALKSRGRTVAMTGDGVNDVLALKDADIGVAMGSGSEATRAVAQIVLLDNNFSALPSVVAEGRRVIGNIERVANLFIVKTVYSVLLAILVAVFEVPYPFLPRHSTLLSTLTIGVPAFFLALAPNKERARPGFVRRVLRYALPAGIITGAATFAAYAFARGHYTGAGSLQAETSVATLTLFLVAMWVLAIIARPYTWWRIGLVILMVLAFGVVLSSSPLQRFFELKLVGAEAPLIGVAIAAVGAVLLELAWRFLDKLVPEWPIRPKRTARSG